jgi:hypothetical protein
MPGRAALTLSLIFCVACGGTSVSDPDGSGGISETSSGGRSAGQAGSTSDSSGGTSPEPTGQLELGSDCDPLADACPEEAYCQLWEGRTQCRPEGSTARDDICEKTGSCEHGSICLFGSELYGKTCQQPCPLDEDPWAVCDIGRHTCFVAVDDEERELPFGVCRY